MVGTSRWVVSGIGILRLERGEMYCTNCGKSIPDGNEFCPNCGAKTKKTSSTQSVSANQLAHQASASSAAAAQPAATYVPKSAVRSNRSLVAYIVLGLLTCGIYWWYFIYSIAQDMNKMCAADGSKTGGLAAYILLSVITCGIYSYWWQYRIADRLQANAPRYGLHFSESGMTVFLWDILGEFLCGIGPFVAMHIIIKNTNAMASAYNGSIGMVWQ